MILDSCILIILVPLGGMCLYCTHTHTHIHAYIDMSIHSEGLTELLLNSKMHVSLCAESCAHIKLKWVLTHGIHISIRDKAICLCMSSCPVLSRLERSSITYNTEKNWLPLPRLSSSRCPPSSPSLQSQWSRYYFHLVDI